MKEELKEKWNGKVNEVKLSEKTAIGGETAFSYSLFEGSFPNRPKIAMEINDIYPANWPEHLRESIGDSHLKTSSLWAKRISEEFKPDLIMFDMTGTHQDKENISPETAVDNLNSVLDVTDLPVILRSAGNFEKQNSVMSKCAEKAKRQVILGSASQDNYRTITASALAFNHYLIAESPIDVNIAKQLNILITQLNFPLNRVIMDPLTGALGYGLEYSYSVMERIRLQTLNDDKMMTTPMVCFVGQEIWKIKETRLEDNNLGERSRRSINWETSTAVTLILSGANIVSVRHPESLKQIKGFINSLFNGGN